MLTTAMTRGPALALIAGLVAVLAVLAGTVAGASSAHAHERDGQHSSHPERSAGPAEPAMQSRVVGGGGFINSSTYEAGAYAFAVKRDGANYLVTAQHVAPPGATLYGSRGRLGQSSVASSTRDTAYVRLTDAQPDGRIQIATTDSGAPVDAAVTDLALRGSIAPGQRVCHSGYAESTQAAGGYVCGAVVDVPSSCTAYRPGTGCEITMRGDGAQQVGWLGDSGGPVWQSVGPGRVRLLGVFTSVSAPGGGPATLGHFVPAYDVLDDLGGGLVAPVG